MKRIMKPGDSGYRGCSGEEHKNYYTAEELADMVGGKLRGDRNREIRGAGSIDNCSPAMVTFAENKRNLRLAEESRAGLVIIPGDIGPRDYKKDIIEVENPRLAYARIAALFHPRPYYKPGIHPSSTVAESAVMGENISLHPGAVVDEEAVIGNNVIIGPGVYIGRGVEIGNNCLLHPRVVIEYGCLLGSDVIVHAGTVIGADGYGYVETEGEYCKIPQLGRVIIGDSVEIGAGVTIDRGMSSPTVIGKGTKIDNLVQIAHNVMIGKNCLIIAQTGIAGSSELGDKVTLAGQVGVVDHIKIADNVRIASKSLVTKDVPGGNFYSGSPAHDHYRELKEQAARRRLPKLMNRIKELERKITKLEGEI